MSYLPPAHLDAVAKKKWAEILPILEARGYIYQGDLDALAAYSTAWSRWLAAEAKVSELGFMIKSPGGLLVPNPYAAEAQKAQRRMRQWGNELKLTPKSRDDAQAKPATSDESIEDLLLMDGISREIRHFRRKNRQ